MDEKDLQKKKIGSRIKVIRNELGLTMKEFGQKFNPPASDSIVSRWERGISAPNNERLKRIAELGNISMLYLTTGKKALRDLSDDEKKEAFKTARDTFKKAENDQKEYLKKEFESILNSDLDFVETAYLTNVLDFLKFSDKNDVTHLASIIRMLNSSAGMETDNSITKEEINNFINGELKDIEKFLKKRFLLLE
ncbi:helix-turn-helix transcriptional regulator [Priestia megaterium]|nr:helix-turn-helix transcriptional regulator [Priestia megaterium]